MKWSKEQLSASFWRRVEKSDSCWKWLGWRTSKGYGQVLRDGRKVHAHRVAFIEVFGQIPEGLVLDHLCRNRGCVRPSHLEAVPNRVNVLRGEGLSAQMARKETCSKGHPLAGDNLRIKRGKHRLCIACDRAHARAYHWANREKRLKYQREYASRKRLVTELSPDDPRVKA